MTPSQSQLLLSIVRRVRERAPVPLMAIQRRSGYPLFLGFDDGLESNHIAFRWTNTHLAVVAVPRDSSNTDLLTQRVVAATYCLEQCASGVPFSMEPEDNLGRACLDTVHLIRAFKRFTEDHQLQMEFLPPASVEALTQLRLAFTTGRSGAAMSHPRLRLAALLVASGAATAYEDLAEDVQREYPLAASTAHQVVSQSGADAVTPVQEWVSHTPARLHIAMDRGGQPRKPKVSTLGTVVDAILSTDQPNSKGFALNLDSLHKARMSTIMRPLINVNHDRSKPPALLVLGAHVCCDQEHDRHVLRAQVAALNRAGENLLGRGWGFSISFHVGED